MRTSEKQRCSAALSAGVFALCLIAAGASAAERADPARRAEASALNETDLADPCASRNASCASCVSDDRCGWCGSLQKCMAGGLDGPKLARCPAEYWSFAYCEDATCREYTECGACIADAFCGWCVSEHSRDKVLCMEGGRDGPSRAGETCRGSWVKSPITPGLRRREATQLDLVHLAMLRDACANKGFDKIKPVDPLPRSSNATAGPTTATADIARHPVILGVHPTSGPRFGGTKVTITGAHFGDGDAGDSRAAAFLGGRPCTHTAWIRPSVIICTTPPLPPGGARDDLVVEVRVGELSSNDTLHSKPEHAEGPASRGFGDDVTPPHEAALFSFTDMRVGEVYPATASTTGGDVIEIRGANLGYRGVGQVASLGGRNCLETIFLSPTALRCVVPPSTGSGLDVRITVGNYTSVAGSGLFSYEEPIVESIEPTSGPTSGNVTITVHGRNFGPADAQQRVMLEGVPCRTTERVTHSVLRCVPQPGGGTDLRVSVGVSSLLPETGPEEAAAERTSRQTAARFSFHAPSITSVQPANGAAKGGDTIVIKGLDLAAGVPVDADALDDEDAVRHAHGLLVQAVRAYLKKGHYADALHMLSRSTAWASLTAAPGATPEELSPAAEDHLTALRRPFDPKNVRQDDMQTVQSFVCAQCRQTGCRDPACASTCAADCKALGPKRGLDLQLLLRRNDSNLALPMASPEGDTADASLASAFLALREAIAEQPSAQGVASADEEGVADSAAEEGVADSAAANATANATDLTGAEVATPNATVPSNASMPTNATVPANGTKSSPAAARTTAAERACSNGAPELTAYGLQCVRVTVGGRPCTKVRVIGHNHVECVTPENVGPEQAVVVIYAGQASSREAPAVFSYNKPEVYRVEPAVVPTIGRDVVTIRGRNFGVRNYAPRARVGDALCMWTAWVDDSTVKCSAPSGMGANQSVTVEVGGQRNADNNTLLSYERPEVDSVAPAHGPAGGGYWMSLFGRNFGQRPHTPQISIGGRNCLQMRWVSDVLVRCMVPPGRKADVSVDVFVADQVSAPNSLFSYDGPQVHSVEPERCDTRGGCRLTLRGENFGDNPHHSLRITVGGKECKAPKHASDKELQCTAPAGIGGGRNVVVHLAGQVSGKNKLFSYADPVVEAISPAHAAPMGGQRVAFRGRNFGWEAPNHVVAYIGDKPCANTTWHNDSTVTCIVPPQTGWNLQVRLGVEDLMSEAVLRFDYDVPRLAFVEPYEGATNGSEVTLYGENFFGPIRVIFGSGRQARECYNVTVLDANRLSCHTVAGSGGNLRVKLLVGLRLLQQTKVAGHRVLISSDIQQDSQQGAVRVEEATASPAVVETLFRRREETRRAGRRFDVLGERAADPAGKRQHVEVQVLSPDATADPKWSYAKPSVTRVWPPHGKAVGGTPLSIVGSNFGPAGTPVRVFVDVLRATDVQGDHKLHSGSMECHNATWVTDREVRCITPSGIGPHRTVRVEIDDQESSPAPWFQYDPPQLDSLSPAHGPPRGGTRFVIHGDNFGTASTHGLRVTIGGQPCLNVRWLNNTAVEAVSPAGHSSDRKVVIEVAGQASKPATLWSYDAPVVEAISPNRQRVHGGGIVIVRGANFGSKATKLRPTVSVNGMACTESRWVSDSQMSCAVPAGRGRNLPVIVTLGNQRSEPRRLFSYKDVDCRMAEWGEWSTCSVPCKGAGPDKGHDHTGPGSQFRTRSVKQPAENFGRVCPTNNETRVCSTHPCPVHCEVSNWSAWSKCPRPDPRNPATQRRERRIKRLPEHGGQSCPVLEESRKCPIPPVKPKTCRASGDPHTTTFDGAWHDFYQAGEFWWTKTDDGSFDVSTILRKCGHNYGGHRPTCIRQVAIRMDGQVIVKRGRRVYVNGRRFGGSKKFGTVHVRARGSSVTVTNDRKETVRTRGTVLLITATYSLAFRTKGLCGTFNNNWRDDWKDNSGRRWKIGKSRRANYRKPPGHSRIQKWGLTYKVPRADSLFAKGVSRFAEVGVRLEEKEEPSVNASTKSPEEACSGLGFDAALEHSCSEDIAITGDYSYVDVYKTAQKMSDAAAKDREALERFDAAHAVKNTTHSDKARVEPISTAPPQGVAHHLERRSWWQALLP